MWRNIEYLGGCFICWNRQPLPSCTCTFRKKPDYKNHFTLVTLMQKLHTTYLLYYMIYVGFGSELPNANSVVDKPEAERAATKAQGPGMGMTVIFASTHNFAYINILYIHTEIIQNICKWITRVKRTGTTTTTTTKYCIHIYEFGYAFCNWLSDITTSSCNYQFLIFCSLKSCSLCIDLYLIHT